MKKTANKRNIVYTIIYGAFIVLVVMTFLLLLLGIGRRGVDFSFDDKSVYEFSEFWRISNDYEPAEVMALPVKLNTPKGANVKLIKTLPDKATDFNVIVIESKRQDVRVIVGNEIRAEYCDRGKNLGVRSMPSAYVMAPIYSSDAGKDVTILIDTDTYYSGDIGKVYLGKDISIMIMLLKNNAPWLILIGVIFIIGMVTLVCYIIYRKSFDGSRPLLFLFWFSLFTTVYCISQVKVRQLFAGDLALLEAVGYCAYLLIPVPILFIANIISRYAHRLLIEVLMTLSMVNFLTQNIVHSSVGLDYFDMQMITQLYILLVLAILLVLCIIDTRKGMHENAHYLLLSVLGPFIGIITEAILVGVRIEYTKGSCFIIGALAFLVFNTTHVFVSLSREQQSKKNAESANKAKSQFLATMSHEIRTPINAVMGMNEMIIRDSSEENIRDYAANVAEAGKSLLALVNDILDFSKIEAGKMDIVCVEYPLKSVLNDLIIMVQGRLDKKKLKLVLDIDENIPAKLFGDEVRIKQILTNLLTNAAKYTEAGSVTFTAKCESIEGDEAKLYFSVKDTGIGIKEADLERLNESSFVRVDEARNRNIEGTGLGLVITRQLLELMDSKLEIVSEYGKGSDFYFVISQKVIDATKMGPLASRDSIKIKRNKCTFTAPNVKILAVDDTKTNLLVIKGLLKPYQMSVETCDSGKKCLELCENKNYDVIFMDHMMPEMDGIETLKQLRAMNLIGVDTKVAALTANAISGVEKLYIESGFDGYLTKPIDSTELDNWLKTNLPEGYIVPNKEDRAD